MTFINQICPSKVGINGIIIYSKAMFLIEIILEFCTRALGIGMSWPLTSTTIFDIPLDGLVIIDVISEFSFNTHGIEFIVFFPKAASGNIHSGCIGGWFPGDDIDNPTFCTRTIHDSRCTAQDFHTFDIIHIIQKCGEGITTLTRSIEVIQADAIHQNNNIRATIDTNTT